MLEQSRQIPTLAQPVTRGVAFQETIDPISQSLNSASNMLRAFGGIQRQNNMLRQQEANEAFDAEIDANAVIMADLTSTLREQRGIDSAYIQKILRGTFPGLDDATYAKVLKRHAEITGESLSGLYKAQDAVDTAAEAAAKEEYAFNLQMADVEQFADTPPPYNGTLEEKQNWMLNATRKKNFLQQRTDDVARNVEQYRLGVIDRPALLTSVKSAVDVTSSMGLSKLVNQAFDIPPTNKEDKMALLTELQRGIATAPSQVQKMVRDSMGVNITLEEAEAMSKQVVDSANIALQFLSGDSQTQIVSNANKLVMDEFLGVTSRSNDANLSSSAVAIQAAIAAGQPFDPYAMTQLTSHLMRFVKEGAFNRMPAKVQEEEVKKLTKTLDALLSPDMSKASPLSMQTQDEHKEFVFDLVMNNLNVPSHKKTPVSDKAAMTIVSAIARNENAAKNLPEGSSAAVLESLKPMEGRIAASVTALLSKPAVRGNGVTAPSTAGADKDFDFNVETLEIRSKGMVRSGEAQNLNKFIKDYIKAVENMGGDVKAAKEDIRAAIAANTGGMTR